MKTLRTKLDKYITTNSEAAVRFFCNSLDHELEEILVMQMDDEDPFVILWLLCLMVLMLIPSIEKYYVAIKDQIKNCHHSQCIVEDISKLSQAFWTDTKELTITGQCNHNLLTFLKMLQI